MTSLEIMLTLSSSMLSRYAILASTRSSGPAKVVKAAESGLKKRLVQRYCTVTAPAKGPIGDIDAVMNKFGLEQKSIVEQSEQVVSYCRCWLSATFPKCDGSHKYHNMATGTHSILSLPLLSCMSSLLTFHFDFGWKRPQLNLGDKTGPLVIRIPVNSQSTPL